MYVIPAAEEMEMEVQGSRPLRQKLARCYLKNNLDITKAPPTTGVGKDVGKRNSCTLLVGIPASVTLENNMEAP
jgi:hypothetical protein